MKRIRLSTVILLIAIVALALAVVVQKRRFEQALASQQRQERARMRDMTRELRDARHMTLRFKEEELRSLFQQGISRDDPRAKASIDEMEAMRLEYNRTVDRLKALYLR